MKILYLYYVEKLKKVKTKNILTNGIEKKNNYLQNEAYDMLATLMYLCSLFHNNAHIKI